MNNGQINNTDIEALKQAYLNQSSNSAAEMTSALMPVFIIFGIFLIAYLALSIIAMWKILKKADEKPWKSLIPFYNYYILSKISNRIKSFVCVIVISLVGSILPWALGFVNIGFIDILCSIVAFGARIAVIVFSVFIMNGLSHAFGHGRGYTVGLVLLNLIFMCIIGLGSSKYFPKAVFDKTD